MKGNLVTGSKLVANENPAPWVDNKFVLDSEVPITVQMISATHIPRAAYPSTSEIPSYCVEDWYNSWASPAVL